MLTLDKFTGINNVQPGHRLKTTELATAINVDIGLDNEIRRRQGFARVSDQCHKNLWQAEGFMLATCNGDLARTDGTTITVLKPSLGVDRVWYCNLPDGRTTFSNGLISGVTDGLSVTRMGVPIPAGVGVATPVAGQMAPGEYRWAVTHVRLSDGLEGGAAYAAPVSLPDGGLLLTALPLLNGYATNIYLSNGEAFYRAGATLGANFSYLGANDALVLPLRTDQVYPMPVGTITAFWRGRLLVASGNVLWASLPNNWEHCDVRRDYKLFEQDITLLQPVDGGIFVGTEGELAFLSGQQWDGLSYTSKRPGRVVLGSGVRVPGQSLAGAASDAMVCISDGELVAGMADGSVKEMAPDRYQTDVQEVYATFREVNGIPQYIAVPT